MALQANKRNGNMLIGRNERTMPKWVTEQTNRIGPKPPPPPSTPENGHVHRVVQPNLPPKTKSQPEPDYEVIEFSNQQYSNAPLRPNSASSGSKTPDSKLKCTLCGSSNPWVACDECAPQIFCASCDDMFHKHPKRKNHQRKTLDQSRPPLPPKILPGEAGPTPPVAPPRRNKRGLMTPLMQRKDQGNSMPGPFPVPASPTPSMKNASWQERFGSLPRGLNIMNRPLPETPKTPSESSRSNTPKSVFDNIQRPPSVALEKIKHKANATLDRMQILQQRYRQQKEQMERERSGSATDQLARQHHQMAAQRANQLGQRAMSSSVFNLNQMNNLKPMQNNNGWMNNSMQQAQSMAQLNCANCHSQQQQSLWNGGHQQHMHTQPQDPWSNQLSSQQHLNRSNLSLNVGAGYMMQPQHNGMYPPPVFMNQRGVMQQMYPQPYMGGMPVMNPGLMGMPPATSRVASRAGSRMASPAMSRHSVTLRRKQRSGYIDDEATDDEDSDEDDRRSMTSNRSGISRSRTRRLSSASQMQFDDEIESSAKSHRNRVRGQRRDSIAKSVHSDWAPGRRPSTSNNTRSVDSGFNSPLKPSRIYSDLDSEGSGTRALVQAKIEQKLKEDTLKQNQPKSKRQSQSPPKQKKTTAIQTPAMKQKPKKELENLNKIEAESAKEIKEASASESEKEEEKEESDEPASEEASEDETKEPTTQNEEQETETTNEVIEEPEIEEDGLGPPPSTPDHEWECEFCTFVNEPNIKICSICCKTPCAKPMKAIKSISTPKQIKTLEIKKDKSKDKNATLTKKSSHTTTTTTTDNHEPTLLTSNPQQSSKIDSALKTEDKKDSTNTHKKQESVEDIWATLDENIQATAHEVTRKANSEKSPKISNASSTSAKSASIDHQDKEIRQSQAREIGTSPPPQNISTQTYDTLPVKKPEAIEDFNMKSSQPLVNDIIQPTNFSTSSKIHDLKSFENEVINNIHNISHNPSHYQHRYQQHQYHPFANERQRYRSNNDLRMDDSMSMDFDNFNGLGRRQPSISELMLLQRTSSQMHSPLGGSIYDLPYREFTSPKYNDLENNHKESDIYKHTTEELNAALKYCGPDMHPLVWLRDNWPKLIQTVQSLATKYGQERAENTIGTISQMEAREALRLHTGNIWQAVSECIEQRQRKYREISNKGNFSREDIVTALTTHQGNVEMALMDLGRSQLKPFLMRIWGSPGGVENESGAVAISPTLQSSSPSTQYNMDKDIHNFLSANATDCMQIPNTTGAFHNNNQMPSPFDLPTTLNTTYENNNHMPDNTSSYSADSKDYAPSPFQLDDSILGNKSVLKDLETLIGNMEQNQQKQNEQVLRSISDMLTNRKQEKPENDYDTESMRILTKSPITSTKLKNSTKDNASENEADVKNFVWQHIQEIVPNLVQQVEMELMEDIAEHQDNPVLNSQEIKDIIVETVKPAPPPPPPPIDQDEFLMEEVIKPNIKTASFREELPAEYIYAAEIATFQMAFDKGLEREHREEFEFDSLEEVVRKVFQMFKAPEEQHPNTEAEEPTMEQINKEKEDFGILNDTLKEIPKDSTSSIAQTSIESQYQKTNATIAGPSKTQAEIKTANERPSLDTSTEIPYQHINTTISEPLRSQDEPATTTETQSLEVGAIEIIQPLTKPFEPLKPQTEVENTTKTQSPETGRIEVVETLTNTSEYPSTPDEMISSTETQYFDTTAMTESRSLTKSTEALEQHGAKNNVEALNTKKSNSSNTLLETPKPSNITESQKTGNDRISRTQSEKNIINKSSLKSNKKVIRSKSQSKELSQYKRSSARDLSNEIAATAINSPETNSSQNENSKRKDVQILSNVADHIKQEDVASANHSNPEENQPIPPLGDVSSEDVIGPIESEPETKLVTQNATSNILISQPQSEDNLNPEILASDSRPSNTEVNSTQVVSEMKTKSSSSTNNSNNNQRKVSKIPVRRTSSNISLASGSKTELNRDILRPEASGLQALSTNSLNLNENPESFSNADNAKDQITDEESEEELLSLASEISETEIVSRADQFQSPISTSEIFLTIQQEGAETISTLAPSTSNSTIHSATSISSSIKSPTEFVPSGDPAKQNLSDLVKDTQRLIKQMKDEISIDDFESSTDDGDYTDEYTDEYDDDDGEEEEWDEEEGEEEEEDDDEYNDLTEDITEENDIFSNEGDPISNANSPLPQQESQDLRDIQNSSVLSNITESSDHSPSPLPSDHIVHKESITKESNVMENNLNSVEDYMSYVETENNSAELPVEHVIGMSEVKNEPSMAYVESENMLPEMPVETVLSERIDDTQVTTFPTPNVEELANSIAHVESENNSTEIPYESEINMSEMRLQPSAAFVESENKLPEMPVETVLMDHIESTNVIEDSLINTSSNTNAFELTNNFESLNSSIPLSIPNELETENNLPELPVETVIVAAVEKNMALPKSATTSNSIELTTSSIPDKVTNHSISSMQTEDNLPSTSNGTISVTKSEQIKVDDDLPSTSKATKSNLRKPLSSQEKSKLEPKKSSLQTKDNSTTLNTGTKPKSVESRRKSIDDTKTTVKKPVSSSKIPKPKEIVKDPKPKDSAIPKPQNEFKKKLATRSKSFSGPPTPIGIASVKTISQRFINPSQRTTQAMQKNQPTVSRKSSITDVINKFTKPSISSEKPSASSLFRSRTQPRLPKKKYHETCFSDDDYETSSSEEEIEPLEIRQRKFSVPVFRAYPSVQEPEEINTEELVNKFIKEDLAPTIAQAQIAATLVAMKFQQDVSLWAAKECSDLDHAIALLKQECELCSGTYALNEIVSMLKCTHKCCKQCAKTYFTVQITERSINDCSCPFCKLPELHNQIEHEDEILEYFSNLDIFLKSILETEVHELFQRKLRDRTLLKDPNFKWCVQCSSGFFARPKQKRLICPDCGSVTCAQCRKLWQKQHEGISCDQFLEWESANDPEVQAIGVKQHLDQNGIDCPKCKFRYSLARGGCMHFTCTQCKYEFCYGCAKPFMMGAKCTISSYCAKLGLHAHHPRNCLFYLRDKLPVQLQNLLKNNGVTFEIDDPVEAAADDNEPSTSSKKETRCCPIAIQKETPTGLVDTKCNSDVPERHAGMCRTHYVEYLTAKVAKAHIDPLPIFDLTDCVQELRRRGIALPERGPWDTDEIYKTMCSEVIQKNIPLDIV